jgi:hypothetical protein
MAAPRGGIARRATKTKSDLIMQQQANFIGKAFRRGDAGYEAARRVTCRNVDLPDRYPDIIVQAANEKDVVAAV